MDVDPPMDAGPAMDELTDAVRVIGLAAGEEDGGDALGHEACMECGGETPVVLGEGRDLRGTRAGENATAPSPDDFDRFGLPSAQAVLGALLLSLAQECDKLTVAVVDCRCWSVRAHRRVWISRSILISHPRAEPRCRCLPPPPLGTLLLLLLPSSNLH